MALLNDLLLGISFTTWTFVILPIAFAAYWAGWVVYARTHHPLAKVPGDLWPSVSRTWLMYQMYKGDLEQTQRSLNEKYGSIVRIAPDEVAVADPEAVGKIYPIQRPLEKANWYHAWRPPGLKCQHDLFTQTSEKKHSSYRRIVGGVYSLGSILKSEGELDSTLNLFMRRIGEFADENKPFDFGLWLEMYAYDNVGAAFFGERFGFLENSEDHGGYIHVVHLAMPFLSVVAMAPVWLRPFVLATAVTIPKLPRAVIAVDGIRRPERWLEAGPEQMHGMEKAMINFGAGTRTCTGKHLALAEIHKVVPEILRRFNYKMVHDGPWKTQNATFVVQTGLDCTFERRELF